MSLLRIFHPVQTERTAFECLTHAVQRALRDEASDDAELQRAIRACAQHARRDGQPPQRFIVQVKECVRGGAVKASPLETGPLMSRVVRCAVVAYYDRA